MRALLAATPLFEALDRAALDRVAAATTRRSVARGDCVFRQGDLLAGLYVLVQGEIRLVARGTRVRRLSSLVRPGSSFGEPMVFLDRPALVSAEAATDAVVLHVPSEAVFEELERHPAFARQIIGSLCRRVESLVNEVQRHKLPSGRTRLVEYLARHARPGPDHAIVQLPVPKASVASDLQLSPEYFSRVLHGLVAEGLIEVSARRIRIPDLERLLTGAAPASDASRPSSHLPLAGANPAAPAP